MRLTVSGKNDRPRPRAAAWREFVARIQEDVASGQCPPFVCLPFPDRGFILWRTYMALDQPAAQALLSALYTCVLDKHGMPITIDPEIGIKWLSGAMVKMGWPVAETQRGRGA